MLILKFRTLKLLALQKIGLMEDCDQVTSFQALKQNDLIHQMLIDRLRNVFEFVVHATIEANTKSIVTSTQVQDRISVIKALVISDAYSSGLATFNKLKPAFIAPSNQKIYIKLKVVNEQDLQNWKKLFMKLEELHVKELDTKFASYWYLLLNILILQVFTNIDKSFHSKVLIREELIVGDKITVNSGRILNIRKLPYISRVDKQKYSTNLLTLIYYEASESGEITHTANCLLEIQPSTNHMLIDFNI